MEPRTGGGALYLLTRRRSSWDEDQRVQADIVERARNGDHDAFALVAGASIDRLYRLARMIVRDPDLAEDVVQDTLLEAWRSLPGLRDAERFEPWINRLLVRAAIRLSRTRRRQHVTELHVIDADGATRDNTERDLVVRDLLDRGFDRLPADERALLVLRHYLDLPVAEIADLVGIPEGTVKSRVHRATQRMRALLDADDRLSPMAVGVGR
jgi:RNA polymerase sigma-70 factor, ECF subfamily